MYKCSCGIQLHDDECNFSTIFMCREYKETADPNAEGLMKV